MRDTLENLYFGNITPNDQIVKSGTALKKAMEQSAECEEKLAELILQMKAEIAALRFGEPFPEKRTQKYRKKQNESLIFCGMLVHAA